MIDTIIQSFDIWTDAQDVKSKGRVKSIDNISLEGIARLRELILDLAIRGKLVSRDPNDEPTSELIKKIEKEKDKLIKEGKIKKQSPLLQVEKDEKLFELPESWKWVRLGEIGIGSTGKTPSTGILKYFGGEIPFIGPGQINLDGKITEPDKTLTDLGAEMSTLADAGDILMVCIGGSIGKSAIVTSKTAFNQQLNCIRPLLIETSFLNIAFNSPYFQRLILEKATGSATPIINRGKWEELLVPLAPIFEQKRIVAKVDELMALCDKLEEEQTNNLKTHQVLVKTLLETLTQAKDTDELQKVWQWLSTHFDTLFCTEDSIDQLKHTILQLAIMGKLVKQDPKDEPAIELIKKMEKEKGELIEGGKIKKEKLLPEITDKEKPFKLPKGWEWIKFGKLSLFINGDRSKNYPHISEYLNEGVPWINTGHIEPTGKLSAVDMNFISREKFDSLRSGKIQKGDLVYCLRGATFGKTAFVEPYEEGAIASSLMIIRPYLTELKNFIFLYLTSPLAKQQLFRFDNGSAQPNLSANSVLHYTFPLPTLAEQKRIVAKVDELMALCDRLKDRIIKSQEIQGFLSKTIVENAIA